MSENSSFKNNDADFRAEIPEYSDEIIIDILKKRNLYQKEAAEIAIQEAIKRGIIHSEQDLFAERYKERHLKFSLFPEIENKENKDKIRKSIARTVLISGIIPLIYAIVLINKEEIITGGMLLFMGILWIFSSAQLIRFYQKKMVLVLYLLVGAALIYVIRLIFFMKNATVMDFFVPLIMCGLILYGLTFLNKLYRK